jgi:ATP-binding cassette subfamily C protein
MSSILMLTGSLFMLLVYDRVLPSRSLQTLIGLAILAGILFAANGLVDLIRGRLLVRIGLALDEAISPRVYEAVVRIPVRMGSSHDSTQPVRDLDTVRSFLSSGGPTALFDLPWMPIYLFLLFAFHPLLGYTALGGTLLLAALTLLTEVLSRKPTALAAQAGIVRNRMAEASRCNAEVIAGMGLAQRMGRRWGQMNRSYTDANRRTSDVAGGFGAIAKVLRMFLQSAVLGAGAYLVIRQEATPGIIIASAILTARGLAPVDQAISNWRGFVAARQSWQRLSKLMARMPVQFQPMPLPAPAASVFMEAVSASPPGEQRLVVQDVSFTLRRGQGLGVIGPSASGKSSLARVLVGAWLPLRGKVRLDGASLDQWAPEAVGKHIGYLPQDVELFAGTVAQNISRFDPEATADAIVKAARAAAVHDLVVTLPNGYDTQIGEGGMALSAGQRQRVALARALYGDPFLVVLDEPDSNLDAEGEQALRQAIAGVRQRGGIVIAIAHRQGILAGVDHLLAMRGGRVLAQGPKEAVLQKLRPPASKPEALRVVTSPPVEA